MTAPSYVWILIALAWLAIPGSLFLLFIGLLSTGQAYALAFVCAIGGTVATVAQWRRGNDTR